MAEGVDVFPLSFAQQRLWFLDRMAPGNPSYNIPLAAPIPYEMNVLALERALNRIVARHESLRTTFRVLEGQPSQVVRSSLALRVAVMDLCKLPPAERDSRTVELATKEAQTPFDLETGPLARCALVKRGARDHVLLLTMHHIISDGWSMGILARELTAQYQACCLGLPDTLPKLPIQYADFAVWQREWLTGEVLEQQLAYWREQLSGLPTLDLPTDRPRPSIATYRGNYHPTRLSAELSAAVRRLARQQEATPFMVLLAAFAALLQRYSGQSDLAIGTAVANRNRDEIEGLIGFFVNSLVLRVDGSNDPPFREFLARVRRRALEAYTHQDLPFEKLVEELQPVRDPSRNPLFQVSFQLVNTPTLPQGGGEQTTSLQIQRGSAIFDLAFTLLDGAAGFHGIFEYSSELFDPPTIARMERHFQQLLEGALAAPDTPLSRLPLLREDERREILALSSGPRSAFPGEPLVHLAVAAQAERSPAAVAVMCGDANLSYAELRDRWRKLARRLAGFGIGPDARVGILMDRSIELVVALLGVLEAGGAYVPLDPNYPEERLRFILQDAGLQILLTHAPRESLARSLAGDHARVALAEDIDREPVDDSPPGRAPDGENLAYILYTSGSTGRPKGVAIPHRALANHMHWMQDRFPLTQEDRVLQRTSYCFDASVWEFFAPLMAGARLALLPAGADKDPERIVQSLADLEISIVQFVPALLRCALDEPALYTCGSLRRVFCGGEALSDEAREQVLTALPVELVNLYGPTEATIDATYFAAAHHAEPWGVPIGMPVANTQARVLNSDLDLVPFGVAGELFLAGDGLARGYADRPAATAERFVPDPYAEQPGARMYRTGDRARQRADGALLFGGREDQQVKLRGFRIELGEIESVIGAVEGVKECAVVPEISEGQTTALTAFIVPSSQAGGSGNGKAASELGREHIARWEQVHDEVYRDLSPTQEAANNIVGWNSSYTGSPLSLEEMAAWRDDAVQRIRRLNPSNVLEIGCGTGLLLTQLAPECARYVGLDYSAPVLRYLETQLAGLPDGGRNVSLLHREADRLDDFPAGAFDTVILNSVVQYFPDVTYLVKVLRRAVEIVSPGGAVFLGDLRSLPLLEAFQLSLALHRAPPDLDPEDVRQALRLGVEQEEELVIDPRLLSGLAGSIQAVTGLSLFLKRGRHANELTRFRYDAVLHVRGAAPNGACPRLDWVREGLSVEALEKRLAEERPERLAIEGVPNRRVTGEVRMLDLLGNGGRPANLSQLREAGDGEREAALEPEEFWEVGERHGYDVRARFSASPRTGCFDVVLRRPEGPPVVDPPGENAETDPECWPLYASNPLRGAMTRRLVSRIREAVASRLPDFMTPTAFVLLDTLPLLPNGKVDRAGLPSARKGLRSGTERAYLAPQTALEEALAILWAEALELDRVGVRDDFFTKLGGHSLLATQLISRIRDALRTSAPLRLVFEAPTVERFAAALLEQLPREREAIETAAAVFVRLSQMSAVQIDGALGNRGNPGG